MARGKALRCVVAAAAAAAGVVLADADAGAAIISVNFSGRDNDDIAPGETAGVVPVPGTGWTNADGSSGIIMGLVDETGTATPALINWNTAQTWNTNDEDNTSQFANPGDENLMQGYIDVFETETGTVTVSGLAPGLYNIYVYSLTAVNGRDSGNIVVEGVQEKSISIVSTSFVEGGGPGGDDNVGGTNGNYNLYPAVLLADGQLDISMPGQTFRTAINGLQIVLVPEPAAFGLLAVGVLGLLARRRRR